MYRKSRDAPELQSAQDSGEKPPQTLKLTDQYLALLVAILTNAGLCEVSGVYDHFLDLKSIHDRPSLLCWKNQQ